MFLHQKIEQDFKEAFKAGDQARRLVLGMLKTAFLNKAIEKKSKDEPLSDQEIESIISSEVKKRRDAAAQYAEGGRSDLVAKEEGEIVMLMVYLPQQYTKEEIEKLAQEAIAQTGAVGEKDFGKVMSVLAPRVKGRADGAMVARIVKEHLSR
ncbi:MAG TPA: GatB/YqeY domain-containing protein [Candidatus Paceibacterota bacterium]